MSWCHYLEGKCLVGVHVCECNVVFPLSACSHCLIADNYSAFQETGCKSACAFVHMRLFAACIYNTARLKDVLAPAEETKSVKVLCNELLCVSLIHLIKRKKRISCCERDGAALLTIKSLFSCFLQNQMIKTDSCTLQRNNEEIKLGGKYISVYVSLCVQVLFSK